jgi:hypothetical protein
MENNQLPMRAIPITKESVIAKATPELTRLNYENMIKDLADIRVEPGNLIASQEKTKLAKKIEKAIDELRVSEKRPHDDNAETIQKAFMEFLIPLRAEIKRVTGDINTVNTAELAAKKKAEDNNNRILSVRAAIEAFINNTIRNISAARTDKEIVLIQKAIGTEKSRKGFYGDLMPQLEAACETLTPQINERKEDIRINTALTQKEQEALQSGDIQVATDIKEEKEFLEIKMQEDIIRLQETAFEASSGVEVVLTETTTQTVKGRRLWRWKVDDIKLLAKKMPELVRLEPDVYAIEALLAEKRKDGSLDGEESVTINGLTFFIKYGY